ncbi:phosphotransferase [Nocardioides marmorisolisilvae]|uniref:Aminoglycoside phosphotransferase family protein n=1 Tax=Nocardioides marmorisolisilvae TaxID=1542737 RepID=A0A3N0DXE8_9ACTN|nr:phosphotransferase [Nocardioides marmorisolisilvae]RNL80176.1 aminoglycoside phosphotransferase family protein [Nocardioides marmorisolisilvae]
MHPALWLAGRAATVGGAMVGERLGRSVPRTAQDIPRSGTDLNAEWLTAVLCADTPGAEVVSFDVPEAHAGTTSRAALRVVYNQAGTDAGLPTDLFTKSSESFAQRLMLGGADVLHGETHFFMTFRPKIEMEAPRGYFGGVDPTSWRSLLIMEDIAVSKGARFAIPTTPIDRSQIEDLLGNMAKYHAACWGDPDLSILKTPNDFYRNLSTFVRMGPRTAVGMERAKAVIPDTLYGEAAAMWEGTRRALDIATTQVPHTLLHGDGHVGQVYITAEGRMGHTDWQGTMRGGWSFDYAYLVSTALEPEQRRAWDHELLEHYLTCLAAEGAPAPGYDEAWLRYRQGVFYPYSAWAFTIGRAFYQPKMQPDEISLACIKRVAAAIDELKSFDAVGL